jgi:hypothetical protein
LFNRACWPELEGRLNKISIEKLLWLIKPATGKTNLDTNYTIRAYCIEKIEGKTLKKFQLATT